MVARRQKSGKSCISLDTEEGEKFLEHFSVPCSRSEEEIRAAFSGDKHAISTLFIRFYSLL
jgi:hypothetical protein